MKTTQIQIRVTVEEKELWTRQARAEGIDVSKLIRLKMGSESEKKEVVKPVVTNPYPNAVIPKGAIVVKETKDSTVDDDIEEDRRKAQVEFVPRPLTEEQKQILQMVKENQERLEREAKMGIE